MTKEFIHLPLTNRYLNIKYIRSFTLIDMPNDECCVMIYIWGDEGCLDEVPVYHGTRKKAEAFIDQIMETKK